MELYKKFLADCHPELMDEANAYIKKIRQEEKAKKERIEAKEKEETRKRVPWYNFPFSYEVPWNGSYAVTETSNISFCDAFEMFTKHHWHKKVRPFPDRAQSPRSVWNFEVMLFELNTDEETFMKRYMEFLYDKNSIGYLMDAVDDDDALTDRMCWDGSQFAYTKKEMGEFMKEQIKKMMFAW